MVEPYGIIVGPMFTWSPDMAEPKYVGLAAHQTILAWAQQMTEPKHIGIVAH